MTPRDCSDAWVAADEAAINQSDDLISSSGQFSSHHIVGLMSLPCRHNYLAECVQSQSEDADADVMR